MRSKNKIKWFFRDAKLSINPDTDEKVFTDVSRARQDTTENAPTMSGGTWKIITKSPLAKLAVAAVLTIATATVLFLWKSTGSGIALADVLNRIEQTSAYLYEITVTITGTYINDNPIHLEAHLTTLVSREYGIKIKCESSRLPITGQRINQEMYILPSQRTITTLMPNEKKYSQNKFDEDSLDRMSRDYYDPHFMVGQILECEHTNLGKLTIDGVEVERFQTTDPNFIGETFGQADIKLEIWVDVKTRLPVRLELDVNKEEIVRVKGFVHDYQWDVSVDAAEFEPVIPDDYTVGQPTMTIGPKTKPEKTILPP